jgi:hypothetical protein
VRALRVTSMEIPIACSLDTSDARAQLEDWQELFSRVMTHVDRVSLRRFEISLQLDLAELSELVKLAQREKACCPFFDFSLIIDSTMTTFVVEVPDGASPVLDQFIANISQ